MSRYTGPRVKKMRALNLDLPGLTRKSMWDRPFPPGVHGAKNVRRRKMSDYKKKLLEKQKLRLNYGLTERQFRRLYKEAVASRDPSGDKLLEFLERRHGARAIAVPWWPLLAFWGMSMAKPRMVLMARSSRSSVVIAAAGSREGTPHPTERVRAAFPGARSDA